MSGKNDTGEIIKEFLDLWQKQFSYMTKDPQMVASMLKMFQQAQEGYFNSVKKESNAKSSAAADISGNADDEIRELYQRIASLEERLSEFESGTGTAGKKATGTSARKKPARARTGTTKATKK
jgi:hypothetical protein